MAAELLASGSRFTREQLAGIRDFLRLGAELSYRRAEEIAAEVAEGADLSSARCDATTGWAPPYVGVSR